MMEQVFIKTLPPIMSRPVLETGSLVGPGRCLTAGIKLFDQGHAPLVWLPSTFNGLGGSCRRLWTTQ
jgi:hypothetical protein